MLSEKIQKLEINMDFLNLRIQILEENIDKKKGIIIEEACKAASISYEPQNETIIPIKKQTDSLLIKIEARIWFIGNSFIDID